MYIAVKMTEIQGIGLKFNGDLALRKKLNTNKRPTSPRRRRRKVQKHEKDKASDMKRVTDYSSDSDDQGARQNISLYGHGRGTGRPQRPRRRPKGKVDDTKLHEVEQSADDETSDLSTVEDRHHGQNYGHRLDMGRGDRGDYPRGLNPFGSSSEGESADDTTFSDRTTALALRRRVRRSQVLAPAPARPSGGVRMTRYPHGLNPFDSNTSEDDEESESEPLKREKSFNKSVDYAMFFTNNGSVTFGTGSGAYPQHLCPFTDSEPEEAMLLRGVRQQALPAKQDHLEPNLYPEHLNPFNTDYDSDKIKMTTDLHKVGKFRRVCGAFSKRVIKAWRRVKCSLKP